MNTVTYNLHSTTSHSVMNGCLYSFGKSFEAKAISHCLIIVEKIIEKIPLRPKEMVLKCDLLDNIAGSFIVRAAIRSSVLLG